MSTSDPTVVLTVEAPDQAPEVFSCNGIPEERAEVRRRFEDVMRTQSYFAFVETSPGKADQVRTFDEVEQYEKKLGLATVTIQPAFQGG